MTNELNDGEDQQVGGAWRNRAKSRPIEGRYKELAEEVRRLLGWSDDAEQPYLSIRAADGKTGVNYSTINAMARGQRPSAQSIIKFARALGGDEKKLLRLAGYSDLVDGGAEGVRTVRLAEEDIPIIESLIEVGSRRGELDERGQRAVMNFLEELREERRRARGEE